MHQHHLVDTSVILLGDTGMSTTCEELLREKCNDGQSNLRAFDREFARILGKACPLLSLVKSNHAVWVQEVTLLN